MTKFLFQWLLTQVKSIYNFLGGATIAIIFGIPFLALFGDIFLLLLAHALTIIGHGMHLVFQLIES